MDSILQTLDRLNRSGVPYILIGGMAARAHGSTVNTEDVDICILACDDHFRRIVEAFADVQPYYRLRPDLPPLTPDHLSSAQGAQVGSAGIPVPLKQFRMIRKSSSFTVPSLLRSAAWQHGSVIGSPPVFRQD